MLISSDERGNYVCKVSRPDGSTTSYLFFQNFEVKITGGKILGSAVMVCTVSQILFLDIIFCKSNSFKKCIFL